SKFGGGCCTKSDGEPVRRVHPRARAFGAVGGVDPGGAVGRPAEVADHPTTRPPAPAPRSLRTGHIPAGRRAKQPGEPSTPHARGASTGGRRAFGVPSADRSGTVGFPSGRPCPDAPIGCQVAAGAVSSSVGGRSRTGGAGVPPPAAVNPAA